MTDTRHLIQEVLYGEADDSVRAQAALVALGPACLAPVISALEDGLQQLPPGAQLSFSLQLLTSTLIELDTPEALPTLCSLAEHSQHYRPLDSLLAQLQRNGTPIPAPLLIPLIERLRGFHVRGALLAAEILLAQAERDPDPIEWRDGLNALRPALFAPLEFLTLHRRLSAILRPHSLPIPPTAESLHDDLPIPSEEERLS